MTNPSLIMLHILNSFRRLNWKKKQLEKFQNQRVRKIIRNAFENQEFYHRLFKSSSLRPEDIKCASDLNKIPIVSKVELKRLPIEKLIANPFKASSLERITTGGSTGQPFSIYINSREDYWRKAIYLRANIKCGHRPRDKWVAVIDPQYSNTPSKLQRQLGLFFRNVIPMTWERSVIRKRLDELNVDVLDGFPNALYMLAKDYRRIGLEPLKPRIIFGSGELIDKTSIRFIEETFSAPYFDQFGCSEIDRSAWQCKQRQSYHIDIDSVITQFVDDEGEEVAPGEIGEIVYTSLFNFAFPIIRYNVKDVGVPIDEKCPCGISLPLMKVVEGRSNSFLVFPGDKIVSPLRFIELLGAFSMVQDIEQYRIIQEKIDKVLIIVKKATESSDELKIRNVLLGNLKQAFPKLMSTERKEPIFRIEFVDEIEHTFRGKLSVVSSKVSKHKREDL
jgi:phenylacetate-CoA ligase